MSKPLNTHMYRLLYSRSEYNLILNKNIDARHLHRLKLSEINDKETDTDITWK